MKTLSTFLSVILVTAISFTGLAYISKENQYTSVRQYNKPPVSTAPPLSNQDQPIPQPVAVITLRDRAAAKAAQNKADQITTAQAAEKAAQSAIDQATLQATQDQSTARRIQTAKAAAQATQAAQDQAAAKAARDQAIAQAAQDQAARDQAVAQAQANALKVNTRTSAS